MEKRLCDLIVQSKDIKYKDIAFIYCNSLDLLGFLSNNILSCYSIMGVKVYYPNRQGFNRTIAK